VRGLSSATTVLFATMPREDGRVLRQALEDALAAGSVVLTSSNSSDAHHPVAHAAHGQDGGSSPAPSTARIDLSTHLGNHNERQTDGGGQGEVLGGGGGGGERERNIGSLGGCCPVPGGNEVEGGGGQADHEPPATRSFSTEDTPASHRQSSIPSAAQDSLITDSRPALPGVYGVRVQPAQRLPDEPAEPHENGHARCIDSPAECGDRYLVNARMSPKAGEQRAEQAWSHSMPRRTNLKISSEYP